MAEVEQTKRQNKQQAQNAEAREAGRGVGEVKGAEADGMGRESRDSTIDRLRPAQQS